MSSPRFSHVNSFSLFKSRVLAAILVLGPWVANSKPRAVKLPNMNKLSSDASSSSRFRISGVEIRGNKKIEKDAIEAKMKLRAGVEADSDLVRADIQSLFRTGFFFDVQMQRQGAQLIVQVMEKPSLVEIRFEGQSELKSEDLLETSGLKLYEVLNLAKLKEARERIQKSYEDKGFYLARVQSEVIEDTSVDGNGARVLFRIEENEKVRIGKISFIGNKKITDTELKERLTLQERGFFSFASSSGQFKPEGLEADTRILRLVYLNAGFVKAVVNRPSVTVTPDRRTIYITYTIEEGEAYEVGEVDFSGDLL
jgi:outer membrane protein insertion porin family